ncbi:MAG: HI0074 family nucleotidyltransferase substrate-binding subunit [Candidatus Orphnella occulta]|nr:HI0074 family nucleotidyltransferase substrate-binding subunit [Candidatus Orphnella occulta]
MKEELKYAFVKLENAVGSLKDGTVKAKDELGQDGVIQRFEFNFELLWKTFKIFLYDRGIDARTPHDVLSEAFKLEWLSREDVYLNMLEDRNKTSHIYDRQTSRAIFGRIKDEYVSALEEALKALRTLTPTEKK